MRSESELNAPSRRATTLARRRQPGALTTLAAGALLAALMLHAPPTVAAPTSEQLKAARAHYESERKACLDGSSHQDRSTCLKEAAAAYADAQRQPLAGGQGADDYKANAVKRCAVQPPEQRADCERMALGGGMQSGSVASGGVVTEMVTRSVENPGAGSAPQVSTQAPQVSPPARPALPSSAPPSSAAPASGPGSAPIRPRS